MNRTWAEISLDNAAENMRTIRRLAKSKYVMAVVKADAYGHGVAQMCQIFRENGADRFGVACLEEALQIRRFGFSEPIHLLGASATVEAEEIVAKDIIAGVFTYELAKSLSDAAVKLGKTAQIHIELDTGMSRVGYVIDDGENSEALDEIERIYRLPNLEIEGAFSHFATSDEEDDSYMRLQFERFLRICAAIEGRGIALKIKHIANSAAIILHPETHCDMVRAGIVLYGLNPSKVASSSELKPVMKFKSHITRIADLEAGRGVSYGRTYITDRSTKVATVPVGYADGYLRCLSKKASVELGDGHLAKIIGRICMDQCMIDVSNVNNISIGDEVTLFGGKVSADDIAEYMDSINYEVVCLISKRIPRVYIRNGREEEEIDYLSRI